MGGLVWRVVAWVTAGLALLTAIVVVLTPDSDAPRPEAAAHYLEQTHAGGEGDGAWSVRRIEARPGRIILVLAVGDGAAAGFLRMPDGARRLAFGPACPARSHPVWERLPRSADIHLRPVSAAGEVIMAGLSCRAWHGRRAGRDRRRGGPRRAQSPGGKGASVPGKSCRAAAVSSPRQLV